jgi:uncharacterized glyoxalase superfamily protein PhnB
MSDVQPMLYIEDLESGIAYYRDQLGFDVTVFGHHKETGKPLIAGATLDGAFINLTNEELFRDEGNTGGGSVRLYFHLDASIDDMHDRIATQPEVKIIQPPTDQHWGDRTLMVRDPWGVMLVFSNPARS